MFSSRSSSLAILEALASDRHRVILQSCCDIIEAIDPKIQDEIQKENLKNELFRYLTHLSKSHDQWVKLNRQSVITSIRKVMYKFMRDISQYYSQVTASIRREKRDLQISELFGEENEMAEILAKLNKTYHEFDREMVHQTLEKCLANAWRNIINFIPIETCVDVSILILKNARWKVQLTDRQIKNHLCELFKMISKSNNSLIDRSEFGLIGDTVALFIAQLFWRCSLYTEGDVLDKQKLEGIIFPCVLVAAKMSDEYVIINSDMIGRLNCSALFNVSLRTIREYERDHLMALDYQTHVSEELIQVIHHYLRVYKESPDTSLPIPAHPRYIQKQQVIESQSLNQPPVLQRYQSRI